MSLLTGLYKVRFWAWGLLDDRDTGFIEICGWMGLMVWFEDLIWLKWDEDEEFGFWSDDEWVYTVIGGLGERPQK